MRGGSSIAVSAAAIRNNSRAFFGLQLKKMIAGSEGAQLRAERFPIFLRVQMGAAHRELRELRRKRVSGAPVMAATGAE
jgi:hypothetical protein